MSTLDRPAVSAGPTLLGRHLRSWLGTWPATSAVEIVESECRCRPGWNGELHPLVGVGSPDGLVISVAPGNASKVTAAIAGLAVGGKAFLDALSGAVGDDRFAVRTVFRWCTDPASSDEVGVWLDRDDSAVPDWLRPFNGRVLVARDAGGDVVSGVGLKRHDRFGHELAVVTTARARGRGLAALLVAQAARNVLAAGALPTYLHLATNTASARVAASAGFADVGWIGLALQDR
ncbi:MAG: GNAT family N-acetyltransferase [Nocardioidaceae bacterium]